MRDSVGTVFRVVANLNLMPMQGTGNGSYNIAGARREEKAAHILHHQCGRSGATGLRR